MDTLTPNEGGQVRGVRGRAPHELHLAHPLTLSPLLPQRFEKMISGMYLGELTRLLLVSLHGEGAVFLPTPPGAGGGGGAEALPKGLSRQLVTPWALETRLLTLISEDASAELDGVAKVLREELGMPRSTVADRRIVQEVAVSGKLGEGIRN
jgi:hexokinase